MISLNPFMIKPLFSMFKVLFLHQTLYHYHWISVWWCHYEPVWSFTHSYYIGYHGIGKISVPPEMCHIACWVLTQKSCRKIKKCMYIIYDCQWIVSIAILNGDCNFLLTVIWDPCLVIVSAHIAFITGGYDFRLCLSRPDRRTSWWQAEHCRQVPAAAR